MMRMARPGWVRGGLWRAALLISGVTVAILLFLAIRGARAHEVVRDAEVSSRPQGPPIAAQIEERTQRTELDRVLGGAWLAIRENGAGTIPDAKVKFCGLDGAADAVALTDSSGQCRFPGPGVYLVGVAVEGFEPCLALLAATDGAVAELQIARSCTLELAFHDENHAPVAGIRARLAAHDLKSEFAQLDALSVEEWEEFMSSAPRSHAERLILRSRLQQSEQDRPATTDGPCPTLAVRKSNVAQESNSDGEIHWRVPAHTALRWALVSPVSIIMNPPHENPGVEPDGERFTISNPPKGLSGVFSLDGGETKRIECLVFRNTTVSGVLNGVVGEIAHAHVQVFRIEAILNPNTGAYFRQNVEEAQAHPWVDGAFHFSSVTPGRKRVFSWWRDNSNTYRFGSIDFDLAAGEHKMLGIMPSAGGATLNCTGALVDPSNNRLHPSEVFELQTPLHARLFLNAVDRGVNFVPIIPVEVGLTYQLVGLPESNYTARVEFQPQSPLPWRSEWAPMSDDRRSIVKFHAPEAASIEVPILVRRVHPVSISFVPPAGVAWNGAFQGVCVERASLERFALRESWARDADGPEPPAIVARLPSGTYDLFAAFGDGRERVSDQEVWNLYAQAQITVVSGETMAKVPLSPGVTLAVTARRPDGTPVCNLPLFLYPPDYWERRGPMSPWLLSGTSDDQGICRIAGVPPHSTWRCRWLESTITAGALGTVTEVQITVPE